MKNITILIVEDEAIIAMELKQTLEKQGYRVCPIASSANDAIRLAEHHQPDIILMDILLKDKKTGIQAAKTICEKINIPIIYMTGNPHFLDNHKHLLPDVPFKVIAKPPPDTQLLNNIKELLIGRQP